MMKSVFLMTAILVATSSSFADGLITCTAQVFEALPDGKVRDIRLPMKAEVDNDLFIRLVADMDGRAYVMSGDKPNGPFRLSITEEPDYTKGSLTTATFGEDGRMQLSVVNQRLVHKIECLQFNKARAKTLE